MKIYLENGTKVELKQFNALNDSTLSGYTCTKYINWLKIPMYKKVPPNKNIANKENAEKSANKSDVTFSDVGSSRDNERF